MKITNTHVYFYTEEFSNWHKCYFVDPIADSGFLNSEQNFMYNKAVFFADMDIAVKILNEPNPSRNKLLGREIKNYNDKFWQCVRYGYMVYANYLKFNQNPELAKILIETEDKILVEASIPDKIWGVGLDKDDPLILNEKNWLGTNLLGKALMEVREMIK